MARENERTQATQPATVAPTPAAPVDDMAAMREQMRLMQQTIDLLMRQQQMPTPDSLWAKDELKRQAHDALQEAVAAYIGLPSQLRSQYEVNRQFVSGKKIYSVLLGTGKKGECPQLYIPADLESDAKSRYQQACGINHIVPNEAHPEFSRWTIFDATDDVQAQEAVKKSWKYEPQAA